MLGVWIKEGVGSGRPDPEQTIKGNGSALKRSDKECGKRGEISEAPWRVAWESL